MHACSCMNVEPNKQVLCVFYTVTCLAVKHTVISWFIANCRLSSHLFHCSAPASTFLENHVKSGMELQKHRISPATRKHAALQDRLTACFPVSSTELTPQV